MTPERHRTCAKGHGSGIGGHESTQRGASPIAKRPRKRHRKGLGASKRHRSPPGMLRAKSRLAGTIGAISDAPGALRTANLGVKTAVQMPLRCRGRLGDAPGMPQGRRVWMKRRRTYIWVRPECKCIEIQPVARSIVSRTHYDLLDVVPEVSQFLLAHHGMAGVAFARWPSWTARVDHAKRVGIVCGGCLWPRRRSPYNRLQVRRSVPTGAS